jgi:hypothetical protein
MGTLSAAVLVSAAVSCTALHRMGSGHRLPFQPPASFLPRVVLPSRLHPIPCYAMASGDKTSSRPRFLGRLRGAIGSSGTSSSSAGPSSTSVPSTNPSSFPASHSVPFTSAPAGSPVAPALRSAHPRHISLAHGLHQASAVASSPAAPRTLSAAITPPVEGSKRAEQAIVAIARTRAILGIAEKALDACPITGPKAVVAAVSEGLKMFQVSTCQCHGIHAR